MANLKASKKDVRRIKRRRARNIPQKARLRTLGKQFRAFVDAQQWEEAQNELRLYYRYLDRAGRRSLIPARRAARYKSRATKLLHAAKQEAGSELAS